MTVMPPDVREDEDTFILENLDFDPVCTYNDRCDHTATWQFIHAGCCGHVDMFCDDHKRTQIAWLQKWSRVGLRCKACGADPLSASSFRWEKL